MTSNVFDNVNFLKVFPHGQKGWKQKSLIIVHHCPAIKYFLMSSWWKYLGKKGSERRKIIWEETKYNLCLVLPNQVMRLHGKNLIIATYSRVRVSIWRRSCADELPTSYYLPSNNPPRKKINPQTGLRVFCAGELPWLHCLQDLHALNWRSCPAGSHFANMFHLFHKFTIKCGSQTCKLRNTKKGQFFVTFLSILFNL